MATKNNHKKYRLIIIFSCVVALAAIIFLFWWLLWARFHVSTDDAYVNGNQVRVTPQISGNVISVNVDDTQLVEQGQIIVELDTTDPQIVFDRGKTVLAETIRNVTQMFEQVYALAASYDTKLTELYKTEIDYLDRKHIVDSGAVSDEDFIHAEADYEAAKSNLNLAKYNLMQAISLVKGTTVKTHPLVEKAKEDLRSLWVNLKRCTIKAPASGLIAQRSVQVGTSVSPSTPLLAIVPLNQMWVDANFKENQLKKIRLGQPAKVTADTYGGSVVFEGTVVGIGGGSGAVFSPLPPQNATGNWIKIVQRVPVRIGIEQEQLKKYPLRLGLSMNVRVDVKDTAGNRVPKKSMVQPLYTTDVFQTQIDGIEEIIGEIIDQNLTVDISLSDEVCKCLAK